MSLDSELGGRPAAGSNRRRRAYLAGAGLAALLAASTPWVWTEYAAHGHEHPAEGAPRREVVIVLGTEVAADRRQPGDRLAGRLRTAAALFHSGRARAVLVSGDGGGDSGDETAVMTSYLVGLGVAADRVVADPHGLDTYDTCRRARDVYGVDSALVVTQAYHLSRAVTLCRHVGIDAEGVTAECPDCSRLLVLEKSVRDYLASGKAAWDAVRDRPPAVQSPGDPAVRDLLTSGR